MCFVVSDELPRHALGTRFVLILAEPERGSSFRSSESTTMLKTQLTRSLRCFKAMTRNNGLARSPPRYFSSTAAKRLRYERFGDQAGTHTTKSQVWWDMSKWNTRQRIAASVVAVCGVYYVAQCVFEILHLLYVSSPVTLDYLLQSRTST